ncbi:MAG: sulfite exporter TauE/SafE family protein [Elusimicrobia bacterium]|nr:sulfite exporter TauE/SafE family protein [Elusimicrobiota bacterium]
MESFFLYAAVFVVAILYSSVGHGGASGYLAVLALASFPKETAVTSALCLNILVSSIAFLTFQKAGYFRWGLIWPFLLGSVPAAYVGSISKISSPAYSIFLALALCLAALRMWMDFPRKISGEIYFRPHLVVAFAVGAVIGWISGAVGIGGGVFLSPLLLVLGWADVKQTSAASACFILFNSFVALGGHLSQVSDVVILDWIPLVTAAFMGGWLGSQMGAGYFSHLALRRVLGVVLWIAGLKLVYSAF